MMEVIETTLKVPSYSLLALPLSRRTRARFAEIKRISIDHEEKKSKRTPMVKVHRNGQNQWKY